MQMAYGVKRTIKSYKSGNQGSIFPLNKLQFVHLFQEQWSNIKTHWYSNILLLNAEYWGYDQSLTVSTIRTGLSEEDVPPVPTDLLHVQIWRQMMRLWSHCFLYRTNAFCIVSHDNSEGGVNLTPSISHIQSLRLDLWLESESMQYVVDL